MQKKTLFTIVFLFIYSVGYSQHLEDSLRKLLQIKTPTDTVYLLALAELANAYRYNKPDTSLELAQKALTFSNKIDYQAGIGRSARVIAIYYRTKGNLLEAIRYLTMGIAALQKAKDSDGLAYTYNTLAGVYKNQTKATLAIEFCQKAIAEFEKTNNKKGVTYVINNLVDIYLDQANYATALEYAQKSLKISEELQDTKALFYAHFTIAGIYQSQGHYDMALAYQLKNLDIVADDPYNTTYACNDISKTYIALNQADKALPYLKKGLQAALTIKSLERQTDLHVTFAKYYFAIQQAQKAFEHAEEATNIAQKLHDIGAIQSATYEKSRAAAAIGNYKDAYESYQLYKTTTDSLQNEKKYKESLQKDVAYQQTKQELENQKKEVAYTAELNQQKIIRNVFVVGFVCMLVLVVVAYILYQNKQKTNKLLALQNEAIRKQKEEIQTTLEVVKEQQIEITEKNKELNQINEELHQQQEELVMLNEHLAHQKQVVETTYTALKMTSEQLNKSISYASDIQQIILPEEQVLRQFFTDFFVIYKPRDVVSGDFYWFSQLSETKAVLVLADCTGHGVPGAFMSMLGSTLLYEIINTKQVNENPADILHQLNHNLRKVLKQDKGRNSDGMDISVCIFAKHETTRTTQLTFAGAKSVVYYVENGMIGKILGDKIYLGGRTHDEPFTTKNFTLSEQASFYLLTDGIIDQNNTKRDKLGTQVLKDTLQTNSHKPMQLQATAILQLLKEHQGNESQRDDISIIGVKLF